MERHPNDPNTARHEGYIKLSEEVKDRVRNNDPMYVMYTSDRDGNPVKWFREHPNANWLPYHPSVTDDDEYKVIKFILTGIVCVIMWTVVIPFVIDVLKFLW